MKQTLQNITLKIREVKNKYKHEGFEIVGVFGSYAKGNADKFSDIDIAYSVNYSRFDQQFKGGFAKILRIDEIKEELQKRLQLKVDFVSLNSNNSRFKKNIQKDMVYV